MGSIYLVLLVFQVIVAFGLVGVILLQHGKGADAGAAFGSAASGSVFGSQGAGNFLTRTTSILAFLFLASSLCLGYIATQKVGQPSSIMDEQSVMSETAMPETAMPEETMDSSDIPSNTSASDIPSNTSASDIPEVFEE